MTEVAGFSFFERVVKQRDGFWIIVGIVKSNRQLRDDADLRFGFEFA